MQPPAKSKSDPYNTRIKPTYGPQVGAVAEQLSQKSRDSNSPTSAQKRGNIHSQPASSATEKKAQRPGSHSVVKKATSNLRVYSSQKKYRSIRQKSEPTNGNGGRVASAGQNYQIKPKPKAQAAKSKSRPSKISPENRSTKSSPIEISDNNESPTFLRKKAFGRQSKSVAKVPMKGSN